MRKTKKFKPKIQVNDFVRVADLKKRFSKGDPTNWSNKLYKITENVNDTIPSYRIDQLSESYKENLLKKTELSRKNIKAVRKDLILN